MPNDLGHGQSERDDAVPNDLGHDPCEGDDAVSNDRGYDPANTMTRCPGDVDMIQSW